MKIKIKKRELMNEVKKRDFTIVGIAKNEINAKPKVVQSKKVYTRKIKHKKNFDWF